MLNVDNLQVCYGSIPALRGISIQVDVREIVSVIGANGAGKSTLLLAIMGIVPVKGGIIGLDGLSLSGLAPESVARRGITLVPEGRHIFGTLTVEENLRLGATIRKDHAAINEDLKRVTEMFPVLRARLGSPAGKLSGGEQQQLAIARAFMSRPRLMLLDEPSLGLAPLIVNQVYRSLKDLRTNGLTILLVEQNSARALESADRTYVLRTGSIELAGSREELLNDPHFEEVYFGFSADDISRS